MRWAFIRVGMNGSIGWYGKLHNQADIPVAAGLGATHPIDPLETYVSIKWLPESGH
jgi:hypothetical protein